MMATAERTVQKYGGTSLGDLDRIQAVAARVKRRWEQGLNVAVVVSAMSGETDRLLELARSLSGDPDARELDVLLSTGEQVSCALLSLALKEQGVPAVSLLGHQVRIFTDSAHGKARIQSIKVSRIERAFEERKVAVVAGFQGIDSDDNITTLGRGGSDTTAVALAAALGAASCDICTDVDGVYTTDPRICDQAVRLEKISYDEMLELAGLGAKVLQIRAVECAKRYGVKLRVCSSFGDDEGTWVVPEEEGMEEILVSGVAFDRDQAKITVKLVPDTPGLAASLFGPLAEKGVVVDMIVQNVSADGHTDLTFTVSGEDFSAAAKLVQEVAEKVGAGGVDSSDTVAKVSVVGLGMRNHAGVAARMFEVLSDAGVNIQMISTSEIKISVVIERDDVDRAVKLLHEAFVEDPGSLAESKPA
jgi:aspartate kinase